MEFERVEQRKYIVNGKHTFELVEYIPYGYHIWNIGKNMTVDYLPLVQLGGCDGCQVIGIMKALPLKDAQIILSVVGYGPKNVKKMRAYIEKHEISGKNQKLIKRMKEALEIMIQIKGIENL